jgi:hypothetical protein
MQQIDDKQPIVAGITPYGPVTAGCPAHAVFIVDYDNSDPNNPQLIINDPFPYSLTQIPEPYTPPGSQLQLGQFEISYASFVNNLNWSDSIYDLHQGADPLAQNSILGAQSTPPNNTPSVQTGNQPAVANDGFCNILVETENSLSSGAVGIEDSASAADHQMHKSHPILTKIAPNSFQAGHIGKNFGQTVVYYSKLDDNNADAVIDYGDISSEVQNCFPNYIYTNDYFTMTTGEFIRQNTYSNGSFDVEVYRLDQGVKINILVEPHSNDN